ncbi:MAG: DinB family protein [Chthonomonas sp.]|nr:DinB family protein [Chthonomonas sp.]
MDIATVAKTSLENAINIVSKDLNALPEEAFTKSFGGQARTVADIVYELNVVNDYFGALLRGESPPPFDPSQGWIKAPADFNQKSEIIAAFDAAAKRAKETVDAMTVEELSKPIEGDDAGRTVYNRASMLSTHLMYHSGQFNFIQTMLGDGDWHWA